MHSLSKLILFSLPLASIAINARLQSRHGHRRQVRRNKVYSLIDLHQGLNFFDGWQFFSDPDPTHGYVRFLDKNDAFSEGLAYVQSDNTTVLAVDDTTMLPSGANRNSIRISTTKKYNGGLFIADFWAMPHGCGVWPAWWSVGSHWPDEGELDIIEGANNQTTNQYALHSGPNCDVDAAIAASNNSNPPFTAHLLGTTCTSTPTDNTGCTFSDTDPRSYGAGFNDIAGGVYAHLWDGSGIKIWHFPRPEIPADVSSMTPNPSNWPPPAAFLPTSSCDVGSHFHDHVLTLDTTLCGDWAGAVYSQMGCPGTCADRVANATHFAFAKWKINYIAVYM